MKNKKMLIVGICLILAGVLLITGTAITSQSQTEASGGEQHFLVNRVNLSVSQTQFTLTKPNNGVLECRTKITIEKTQPDFYGMLNSIVFEGTGDGYVVYTAGKNNGDAVLPEAVMLPTDKDGKTVPLEWDIIFSLPYEDGKPTYDITLNVDYTTGVKVNTTQRYQTSIPVQITVK